MKERSYRSNLYNNIINLLKKEVASISDISEKLHINWETTRDTLEILKQVGILDERLEGNKRMFFIKNADLLGQEEDTILGLHLTDEERETTSSLFKRIKFIWDKKTNRPINKTFLQKIAVKLVKENQIKNIPYGWYLFGMTCILQVDPNEINVKRDFIGDKYDNQIKKVVEEYSKFSSTEDLMNFQYTEEGNDLYLTKLKLGKDFLYNFKEDDLSLLKKRVLELSFNFKKTEDNQDIKELLDGFISIFGQLVNKLSIKELEDIRSNISETFKVLWDCIATYNLYKSLLDNNFYDKEVLFKSYSIKIKVLNKVCESYLDHLYDLVPKKEIKNDLSKFKGVLA